MIWYSRKWGRLAFSKNRTGQITDVDGRWVPFAFGVWWLTERAAPSTFATYAACGVTGFDVGTAVVQCEVCGKVRPWNRPHEESRWTEKAR